MPPATEAARFLAGFVAAEGCFTRTAAEPRRFYFSVGLGAADDAMCELLRWFLGVGSITRSSRRKPHYDDEAMYQVRRLADLVGVIVPFMDEHLPPSHKRTQFEAWRAELIACWDKRSRRRMPRLGPLRG